MTEAGAAGGTGHPLPGIAPRARRAFWVVASLEAAWLAALAWMAVR